MARRIRDLPRQQRRQLQTDTDEVAEELVAEEYDVDHRPDRAEWFDCVNPRTGTKYEVKSCLTEIGEQYPASGRFRLRRDQTRSLLSSDAAGVAWYVFVLIDVDDGRIRFRRAKPSTVSRWVRERGGWNRAGHDDFDQQHKLPWDDVF